MGGSVAMAAEVDGASNALVKNPALGWEVEMTGGTLEEDGPEGVPLNGGISGMAAEGVDVLLTFVAGLPVGV
jgi:hypothetical protein